MKNQKTIFSKIGTSRNLPSLPHILLKLLDICSREETDFKELSRLIEKDPSLSSRVIRMVNSSYYCLPNKVNSIDQALLLLGINAVKNIAVSASVCQAFSQVKDDTVFNLKLFWWHSLTCAVLAKLIAKKILYTSPDEAFLSGLLHDIGKLVLLVNFPEEYPNILMSYKNQPSLLLTETEEVRLGATHCEVGAWLINRWNLQSFMEDAVLYHHEPIDKIMDALPLVKIIYTANTLSSIIIEGHDTQYKTAEYVFDFTRAEVEEIVLLAQEEVNQIAQSLSIEIEPPQGLDSSSANQDQDKQNQLISEVTHLSMLQGTLQNLLKAYDRDSILKVIQQGFQILFDINDIFFLMYDTERKILTGKDIAANSQNDRINELAIPFLNANNIFAKSLCTGTPINFFNDTAKSGLTIIDKQIIGIMGKDGIMCLPMLAHKQYIGVIVTGMDESHFSHLSSQVKLLTMFTSQAALSLHAENLRQNQAKLIQSERFEASLKTAREIGHEVNTPLNLIKSYLKILELKLKKLNKENNVRDEIRIINEEIDRAALFIRKLSDLTKPEVQQPEPLDINSMLTDFVKITSESLKMRSNIHMDLNLEHCLPTVIGDKNHLKQVFINLIKNAVEAMPKGGNLSIHTQHISKNNNNGKIKHNMPEDSDYVGVIIRDDGEGIPDAIKSKLFEPFVTSKRDGHSGIGLSIVYNIIKELKGSITCESDQKTGTSFKVILPAKK